VNASLEVVDLIDEALLHDWHRLRQAIQEQRRVLRNRERVRLAVQEWKRHEETDAYLLDGVLLTEARDLATYDDAIFADQEACRLLARSTWQYERTRRHRDGVMHMLSVVISVLAICTGFGAVALCLQSSTTRRERDFAIAERNRADQQARLALSRRLEAEGLKLSMGRRLDLGLLLLHEAQERDDTPEGRNSLLTILQANPYVVGLLRTDPRRDHKRRLQSRWECSSSVK
jgi:hypothetical protein